MQTKKPPPRLFGVCAAAGPSCGLVGSGRTWGHGVGKRSQKQGSTALGVRAAEAVRRACAAECAALAVCAAPD